MKLKDLPDDFTPQQFRQLDAESLNAIPYTRKRWVCMVKGCKNSTAIRDYGLEDGFFILDRNSKDFLKDPHDYWRGPNNGRLCSKHWPLWQRLLTRFDVNHVYRRLVDFGKEMIIPDPKWKAPNTVEQIEKRS